MNEYKVSSFALVLLFFQSLTDYSQGAVQPVNSLSILIAHAFLSFFLFAFPFAYLFDSCCEIAMFYIYFNW